MQDKPISPGTPIILGTYTQRSIYQYWKEGAFLKKGNIQIEDEHFQYAWTLNKQEKEKWKWRPLKTIIGNEWEKSDGNFNY